MHSSINIEKEKYKKQRTPMWETLVIKKKKMRGDFRPKKMAKNHPPFKNQKIKYLNEIRRRLRI